MLRKATAFLTLILLTVAAFSPVHAQETITSDDIDGDAVWTADTEYVLDGYVYVEDGETLTIEAGTVIRGMEEPSTGDPISALIVAQGGKIYAEGTAHEPIIFTAQGDDVSDPNDMALDDRGLWGGVVILGNAPTNEPTTPHIEGIPESERTEYGGDDPRDDSGIFRYVSIRHGGQAIAPGNEINGLTFGGVGSRTTIEYVEVYNNQDDCFEWFGGTAQTRFLVGGYCGDDSFDYDQGFDGKGQFWFTIQPAEVGVGNRTGEHDGGDTEKTATPLATPEIYNVTYLGGGVENADPENQAFAIRDNGGGHYSNSIFHDFGGNGLNVADEGEEDSRERLAGGDLTFENNLWYGFGPGNDWADIAGESWGEDYLANSANSNWNEDPMLRGISRQMDHTLDPRPQEGSPAFSREVKAVPTDSFFVQTNYLGAFGRTNWAQGWTFVGEAFMADPTTGGGSQVTITSEDINGDEVWTADTEYVLDGYVYVEDGETLTIEAGTVIRGMEEPSTGDPISALIVAQGGKIYAEGTAHDPIIFTAEGDDVSDPNDMAVDDRGLWGGVVILGNAPTNEPTTPHIEGIPESERTEYGGTDEEDDSGIFRYVSIRHGGQAIAPGNEINGLTFGGVGRQTTVEWVEVYNNQDDCFEWFGGVVQTRFLVGGFCGDDSFDYDQGFDGQGQYWFTIQSPEVGVGNRAGEHDGGDTEKTATPLATPDIYNVTYLGGGVENADPENQAFAIRDNGAGHYHNSIFHDFGGNGLNVADEGEDDSRERLASGDLTFENNLWYGFGPGNDWSDIAGESWTQNYLANGANNNWNEDPMLRSINRSTGSELDPRPQSGSPALDVSKVKDVPMHTFYAQTNHLGAFGHTDWSSGWTFASTSRTATPIAESETAAELPEQVALEQNYPNPFNPTTNIQFELDQARPVTLTVYDALGQKVRVLVNGQTVPAGTHTATFDASGLASGVYYYRLSTGGRQMNHQITRKMLLIK